MLANRYRYLPIYENEDNAGDLLVVDVRVIRVQCAINK